ARARGRDRGRAGRRTGGWRRDARRAGAGLPAPRSPCHPRPDRPRRPVPLPPGRHRVPEPRAPAATAPARPLPRVHRRHARPQPPRRSPHRHRRRPAQRVVLHRRPLPQLPRVRTGAAAMTDVEPGTLLANPARAGTCFVDPRDRAVMMEAAAALDFRVVTVDLASATGKPGLIDAIAAALEFPSTFGSNWDALADGLGDLSWLPAPGYMMVLDHPHGLREAAPDDFDTLLEILDEATHAHARAGTPFWTLIPKPG